MNQQLETRYFRAGGMITVYAVSKRREPLQDWLADQYAKWHPEGYGTMAGAIQETPDGFAVNVFRAESCE